MEQSPVVLTGKALELVRELQRREKTNKLKNFRPGAKQLIACNSQKRIITLFGGNQCLAKGSRVHMADGTFKKIEDIVPHEWVMGWDIAARQLTPVEVVTLYVNGAKPCVSIRLEDYFADLTATLDHRVLVHESQNGTSTYSWAPISDVLGKNLKVVFQNGTSSPIGMCCPAGELPTYDLEVDHPDHAFICEGVVVHNSGKTSVGGFITSSHSTGIYPDFWEGRKFTRPVEIACIGKTAKSTREVLQKALLGDYYDMGTGYLPKDCIDFDKLAKQQGVANTVDTIYVRHASGGLSKIVLLSYEMGEDKIMGQQWDFAWLDEESYRTYFSQVRERVSFRKGTILMTFTPEDGMTDLCHHILDELPEEQCERIFMTLFDSVEAGYYPKDILEEKLQTMPEWEQEFRIYGRPSVGEGRIFQFAQSHFVIDPFEPEPYWRRIGGLDVGYGHATGAVDIRVDDSTPEPTFYVVKEYWSKEQLPNVHAAALRPWGDIDFEIDPSANRRAPTDGQRLMEMYKNLGLSARNADNSVEASILKINELFTNSRLFVFRNCPKLIEQIGLYRRRRNDSTGRVEIVKRDDDMIDPLRYGIMGEKNARIPGLRVVKQEMKREFKYEEWHPADARAGY